MEISRLTVINRKFELRTKTISKQSFLFTYRFDSPNHNDDCRKDK